MTPNPNTRTTGTTQERTRPAQSTNGHQTHDHRTAKIIELVGASKEGFEDAVRCVLEDASASTRGITGCQVENFSVKCDNGKIVEFRVNVKVSFGIERTPPSR